MDTLDRKSVDLIAAAYATASAGMHPSHTLPLKLQAIADAGFKWTEVAMPDLEQYAESRFKGFQKLDASGSGDLDMLVEAAEEIHKRCLQLGLHVLTLMPFDKFEGYEDASKLDQNLQRARAWFKVMKALDCQMLQVGSSNDPDITSDFDIMARDLQALAVEAASQNPPIRIAYEMWAWGTYVNSWEHVWEICKRVDMPNFGMCLDTFQISATHYASAVALPSSLNNTVPPPQTTLASSLEALTSVLSEHTSKIFYLQISDGALVDPSTLSKKAAEQGIHALYAWSNEYRPLLFQGDGLGGFLPVMNVISAVLRTGWRGPWSYEVFYAEDQKKGDLDVPVRWAMQAMSCHEHILQMLSDGRH